MTANYELILTDPLGHKIAELPYYVSLEYSRKQNEIGKLELILPAKEYPLDVFLLSSELRVDSRIEVWRRMVNRAAVLDMDTAWFIRKFRVQLDANGEELYVIDAVDSIDLLDRRIVPYNEGMELLYADKVDYADDMMKAIMEENYGPTALDADRDISDWIEIEVDASKAPSLRKSFSRRKVLDIFKEIAESSYEQGTVLIFDLVYRPNPTQRNFIFRTYTSFRGIDRSRSGGIDPLIVSAELGSLSNVSLEYDQSSSRNFIYAGGQSIGQIRAVKDASDDANIALSPYNRRELFINASDTDDDEELTDEAEYALQQNRGKVNFAGTLVETNSCQYGRDFGYGWKITAEYGNIQYDVYVDAVSVSVNKNGENIDVALRSSF